MRPLDCDALVIGGGIIGCTLALQLRQSGQRVLVIEAGPDLLGRASFVNQARVHQGYHYPRSLLTGMRSRVNFNLFVSQFGDCIDSSFDQYYAIGKYFSKITSSQFKLFCNRIQAEFEPAPKSVKALFSSDWIDEVYRVKEYAFDAVRLKNKIRADLLKEQVQIKLNCEATKVEQFGDGLKVSCSTQGTNQEINAAQVFNCTYSQLNKILTASGLPIIPLKHELTELALVEVPTALRHTGITVMDGPFFSIMPFPARGLHTLSHVRYTPHHSWHDKANETRRDGSRYLARQYQSKYTHMIMDASRYVPLLKHCRHVKSLWEIKTILPRSEVDDSRPILIRRDHGLKNFTCILGAKIDNIYDVFNELQIAGSGERK